MKRVKVLIVDKNVLARQTIVNILKSHPNFEIAGISRKFEDAIQQILISKPDVILIGIEDENADVQLVFNTLKEKFPLLPIIVLSSKSRAGACQAFKALQMGAVDFITKADQSSNLLYVRSHFEKRLFSIINAAISSDDTGTTGKEKALISSIAPTLFQEFSVPKMIPERTVPFDVVVIGGCTGGLEALFELIPSLPSDFSVPIIIAQHCPAFYSTELARQLDELAALDVQEAYEGAELKSGVAWVIPGGYHAEIQRQSGVLVLKMHKGPREKGHRPSINVLFRSASRMFGRRVLAIMLSGSGEDGLEGIKTVKSAGGQAIVQHPDSALAPHLPRTIIRAGYADSWYYPQELAPQIIRAVQVETEAASTNMSFSLLGSGLSEELLN